MIRNPIRATLLIGVLLIAPVGARAQLKPKEAEAGESELVVKVYRVLGLVTPAPDYAYDGTFLPALQSARSATPFGGGMGGLMGGMGGGTGGMGAGMMMGGGMGGGMGMMSVDEKLAQRGGGQAEAPKPAGGGGGVGGGGAVPAAGRAGAPPRRANPMRIEMSSLIDVITNIVEPASWDEVGGEGSISRIGTALAVRQTPAVHAKVKSFLEDLQRETGTLQVLTVKAQWLLLDDAQLRKLRGGADEKKQAARNEALDREALGSLPAEARHYSGQITCFNGQTVHIISGRLENLLQGGIPVVGGSEVGYQPLLLTPHFGVLLQVTPAVLPGDEGVMLDVQSSATRWDSPGRSVQLQGAANGGPVVQIDRLNVTAQQFATSMRIPLGQPVLVGGMTFPGREPESSSGQLHLVLEVESSAD
jgi:hypothetical protein